MVGKVRLSFLVSGIITQRLFRARHLIMFIKTQYIIIFLGDDHPGNKKMLSKFIKKQKALNILVVSTVLLFSFLLSTGITQTAKAATSYTGVDKSMQFYLHHLNNPVTVAGLETKYIMNTSKQFSFSTQEEALTYSLFKEAGLPKIEVDFYLYPNLAGPVTIDGSWQVYLWINGSAYKPAGFTLQFKEITAGGTTLWDSGSISPVVTSSIGEYIDVPIYNYNMSTSLSHTFSAGSTLFVGVSVNSGSSADTRIWYDSALYPSKVVLPAKDYAKPIEVKTYSYDNNETSLFNYNWSQSQRVVILRANVTNPFGGYDTNRVNATIFDPAGNTVLRDVTLTRTSSGQWATEFSNIYEANYTYASTVPRGSYTVIVSVVDNNGYYNSLDRGTVAPFIEHFTTSFSIGVIMYYNPAFQITDDVGDPLPNAQVYVQWPNGTSDILPRYTSTYGFINFTGLPTATYKFTVVWKDVLVKQATIEVTSNGPYVIKTDVYRLLVNVVGNDGSNVNKAYVIAYTQSGVGYGLSITNQSGQAVFRLPKGTYDIEAHYISIYWLSEVSTAANMTDVVLDTSKSRTITLTEFPPSIWATTGIWLIITPIVTAVLIAVIVYVKVVLPKHRHA